ncbi:LON peptidase N-terminal domain and RING finger protein 2-like [Impatiens glandulifera]|uniref:LON peptidase N-terminal domain and RING finger protein 2-like n=1 Tax=Impatiens glandulifera TaxID=253017 RepID=UPI001FB15782|nr:LON peptidase N-terminal domain and RING finger protein 2-like [Impatiens glandulifera]
MGIGCCGTTWGTRRRRTRTTIIEEGPPPIQIEPVDVRRSHPPPFPEILCNGQNPTRTVMNLAAALAAERQIRAGEESDGEDGVEEPMTPPSRRVSLMRLIEESDGVDMVAEGCDSVCCVCMGRKKGAAFIPCGHTFCRVCSRELWVNRGSCPLCNRLIMEILDIF